MSAARAKQLTRLSCLVVYVKFQFVYTTKGKMGSQLLLASKLLLIIMRWQVYRLVRLIGKVVRFQHRGTH